MKNKRFQSKIKPSELMSFGLNPYHWLSIEENDFSAQFMNIDDPELRLLVMIDSLKNNHPIISVEWVID